MPCRGGGPSRSSESVSNAIAAASSPYDTYGGTGNGFSQLASRKEVEAAEKERDEVTGMLCELCQLLEDTDPKYINNPILKTWWETHKELDRIRLEEYRVNKSAALKNATEARTQQKKYMKYVLDEFLDKEDKEFFNKKIAVYQLEINQAIQDFPELASKLGPINP